MKQKNNQLIIEHIDQIDLDSHGVIEASAGTGKTYTIEHLVVNLLLNDKVRSLEEILIVTFTEKAAGELRERIRKIIAQKLDTSSSPILQQSLDYFDRASIYTIHGFCNKVLQEYAFENGEQFQYELTDDAPLYERLLNIQMSRHWPSIYKDSLEKVLKLSGFPDVTGLGVSKWKSRILHIAQRYQPLGKDRLIPEVDEQFIEHIAAYEKKAEQYLKRLIKLAGNINRSSPEKSDFLQDYTSLNIKKNMINKRLRIVRSVLSVLTHYLKNGISLSDILLLQQQKDLDDEGFHILNTGWKSPGPDYREKLPNLMGIIECLEKVRRLDIGTLQNQLAVSTILQLKNDARDFKNDRGLISYDDMISLVYTSLCDANGQLSHALRRRYRYALVDEFQDTDMLQWMIFKRIFLEGEKNRLFIIGDPKQAIYAFRGADISAYFEAKNTMINTYNAYFYSLNQNWRSQPGLIHAFNTIFSENHWFNQSRIDYTENIFPPEKAAPSNNKKHNLFCINLGICPGTEARFKMACFIAQTIKSLLHENRSLQADQIAVLATKWNGIETVEKELRELSIHCSYYKKEGLFQSPEAYHLYYIFTALSSGNESDITKALLTPFFNIPLSTINRFVESSHFSAVIKLFDKWQTQAVKKQWSALFRSLIEDSGLLNIAGNDSTDEQSVLLYNYILDKIMVDAYTKNMDMKRLLDHYTGLIQSSGTTYEDYNLHAIDIENPGVQLLTMHASKGLQFKIVFIAGGFTQKDNSDYWNYHAGGFRIFDLVQSQQNQERYESERLSESERLFYVAMTRAADRLYVPFFTPSRKSLKKIGIIGSRMPSALRSLKDNKDTVFIRYDDVPINTKPEKKQADRDRSLIIPDPLIPGDDFHFLNRRVYIESFSRLKASIFYNDPISDIYTGYGEVEIQQPGDDDSVESIAHVINEEAIELPHGNETGLMLHEIFENIDFKEWSVAKSYHSLINSKSQSSSIVHDKVCKYFSSLSHERIIQIKEETARIVWHTLHSPIDKSGLKLCRLNDKIHEMEFILKYTDLMRNDFIDNLFQQRDGFIHGFIDLIFRLKDKFYILDWKSNFIHEGYSRETIEKNIHDSHYDLQLHMYTHAVNSWLKKTIEGYSYNNNFGGVYYIYVRGMDIEQPSDGVYFYRPVDEQCITRFFEDFN